MTWDDVPKRWNDARPMWNRHEKTWNDMKPTWNRHEMTWTDVKWHEMTWNGVFEMKKVCFIEISEILVNAIISLVHADRIWHSLTWHGAKGRGRVVKWRKMTWNDVKWRKTTWNDVKKTRIDVIQCRGVYSSTRRLDKKVPSRYILTWIE